MEELKCDDCNSTDIKVEEKIGRGLPPDSYNPPKLMPKPKISWKGVWKIYTCNKCGNTWKKLMK